jgi:hypothetical protein
MTLFAHTLLIFIVVATINYTFVFIYSHTAKEKKERYRELRKHTERKFFS